ncbi:MAG: D-alanine--D-alanine ligase [Proteobacteria bacterium]|nr:D-alanine--D-alanine ligase [Pseudomonadota bacterium]MBU2226540.1 D-alanine--D-alanine ligase [Pseudomonadota bacterium]MBU2261746.1 D-alanine--D-alanine ligase [Pseudomonadota bacterium]
MQKLRVGVILGGMSSEREVSLNSGRNVYDNLDREAFDPIPIFMDGRGRLWVIPWQLISQNTTTDITERLEREARRISYEGLKEEIDFAFISLHGKFGEDGCLQGLLELLGLPYTGPGVLASALGMDKHIQQMILKAAGIGVPESVLVREETWRADRAGTIKALCERFRFPLFTKPPREGSSIGVTLVRDEASLVQGIEEALKWDKAVLVEEFLDGKEFSSIILEEGGEPHPLELTEITPQSDYFTYDDKYMPGRCRKFTPPKNIPPEAAEAIKREAILAFRALGFRSYGRIDGFYLADGRILITDPNSSSGMAPSSFFFEQAACAGMLPAMIISRLIENALVIHRGKQGPL